MEANKEQAFRCRDMAMEAFSAGDGDKALRLLEKSLRMYPDDVTRRLIAMVSAKTSQRGATGFSSSSASFSDTGPTPTSGQDSSPPSPNLRRRRPSPEPSTDGVPSGSSHSREGAAAKNQNNNRNSQSAAKETTGASAASDSPTSSSRREQSPRVDAPGKGTAGAATSEQEKMCHRILETKDYYAVLGVPKSANDEQIKKSYKKLAFQLHPDKNKAPSAEEAFKKISKAFQCLSDSNKRAVYDQFGNEEDVPQQQRSQYEADFMTPEELFEAFFGVDMGYSGRRRVYRRVRRPQTPNSEQQQRIGNLVQMLPVLILLAITVLSSLFHQAPRSNFDFQRSASYPLEQKTQHLQVKYFTATTFASDFPPLSRQRNEVELEVEVTHFSKLCHREQNDRLREVQRATFESRTDKERRQRIEGIERQELHNCKKYADLRNKYGRSYGSRFDPLRL